MNVSLITKAQTVEATVTIASTQSVEAAITIDSTLPGCSMLLDEFVYRWQTHTLSPKPQTAPWLNYVSGFGFSLKCLRGHLGPNRSPRIPQSLFVGPPKWNFSNFGKPSNS